MSSFKNLLVWQKANALEREIDAIASRIRRRHPRLADQLERAAESITAAIAEGRGRSTDRDFAHYVSIAIGSASELENWVQRAFDKRLISEEEHVRLTLNTIEVRKMLIGLRNRLLGGNERA